MKRKEQQTQADPNRSLRRASLTVECAAILTLFLLICLALITFMDAIRLQTEKNMELSNQARRLAAYAGLAGDAAEGIWIDLGSTERFSCARGLLPIPDLKVAVRARVYPWIGGNLAEEGGGAGERGSSQMVYVTDHESVYHTHADCTHLDLTIRTSTTSEVRSLRNDYGERYRPCDGFPAGYTGTVYLSAKGNCYYPSSDWGGITRSVRMVEMDSVYSIPECSRCSARNADETGSGGTVHTGDAA